MSMRHPLTNDEAIGQAIAGIILLAIIIQLANWAWRNLALVISFGLLGFAFLATCWLIYRNRLRIARWVGDLSAHGFQQLMATLQRMRLTRQINDAEQTVRQLRVANSAALGDRFNDEHMHRRVRRLRRAKTVDDVNHWRQRREDEIEDLRRQYDKRERQDGPTNRSQARQEVRLFFGEREEILSRYFHQSQVEHYIRRAMHDGLPSDQVLRAGQRMIDHFQRQLIIHDLWQVFLDCRRWLAGGRSDDRMIRTYIRDSLGAHRPVEHVKQAADEMMQQLQHFTNVAKQQANADGSSAADEDEKQLDIDQTLWDQIAQQVDSQLQAWGRTYSAEKREAEIRRRYQRIIGQQSPQ